jgi:hypothetical protein
VRHCLEQALDLSKNVSEQAKRDLGNSLQKLDQRQKPAKWAKLLIIDSVWRRKHDFFGLGAFALESHYESLSYHEN